MSVVTLFTHFSDEDEATLRYAASLAQRLDRRLDVICAVPDPSLVISFTAADFAGVGPVPNEAAIEADKALREKTEATYNRFVSELNLPADRVSYRDVKSYPDLYAADAAILADAIVFPRQAPKDKHLLSRAFETVLMDHRLPVIAAGTSTQEGGPVIIAWDGSDQAARCVIQHAHIIERLRNVIIAQAEEDIKKNPKGDAYNTARLEAWLADRGISSTVHKLSGSVGSALLDLAKAQQAEMILLGAYGHSRAGQFLFGGVTRTLLRAEESPALALSH